MKLSVIYVAQVKSQKFAQVKWFGVAHLKSLDFDQVKISRKIVALAFVCLKVKQDT